MIQNTLSLSQPLHSMPYNDHLAQKLQGNPSSSSNNQMFGMGQGTSQGNFLDQSGFATELRSQKTVTALLNVPQDQVRQAQDYLQTQEQRSQQGMAFNPLNYEHNQSTQSVKNLTQSAMSSQNYGQSQVQTHGQSSMERAMQSLAPQSSHPLESFIQSKNTSLTHNTIQSQKQSMNPSLFGITLGEKGVNVDQNGNIHIPETDTIANNALHSQNSTSQTNNTEAPHTNTNMRGHSVTLPLTNQTYAEANTHTLKNNANNSNHSQAINSTQTDIQKTNNETTHNLSGIPINAKGIPINNRKFFALDQRSLGILSRVADRSPIAHELIEQNTVSPSQSIDTSKQIGIPLKRDSSAIALHSTGLSGTSEIFPQLNQTSTLAQGQNLHIHQSNYSKDNTASLGVNTELFRLGSLAKQYESGSQGTAAIGYDKHGGTSYGTFQISSRAGTFNEFLKFLDSNAPDWAEKLRDAGNANTGSRGGAVPKAWKELCAENSERMERLEYEFIVKTHYQPVASYVEETWKGDVSPTLQEVIFSTAVQHGVTGAKKVFNQAFKSTDSLNLETQEALIKNVYSHRSTKFSSSTPQVQEAARNRMIHEQREALASLT